MNPGRADAASEADGLPALRQHRALVGLWMGMAMSVLNSAIVYTALSPNPQDRGVRAVRSTWVVPAYLIAV